MCVCVHNNAMKWPHIIISAGVFGDMWATFIPQVTTMTPTKSGMAQRRRTHGPEGSSNVPPSNPTSWTSCGERRGRERLKKRSSVNRS